MVQNYEFLALKFVLVSEGELNRVLPKTFAGKNLQMTQNIKEASRADLIKKGLTWCVKNRCMRGR